MSRRKRYDDRFKAQVAIEAIKNQQTVAQIASHYGVHPTQVSQWKKQVLEQLPQLFADGRSQAASDNDQLVDELYRQIGQLKVELDWLRRLDIYPVQKYTAHKRIEFDITKEIKKKRNCSVEQKRQLVEKGCHSLSVVRQCELLGLSRASFYYRPVDESPQNLLYMRLIDEQYTKTPFYGIPRLTVWLRSQGHVVNRKRVARLMRKMGLAAIYPKPKPTGIAKPSKTYPYLLKGLSIIRPNQVWATDITYIRLTRGFVYLVAVMDWFSRYVLAWELSNSLDVYFCLSALERALSQSSPLIFNNDQGSQFTSDAFTARLQAANIAISWDGRGSYFDNIFIERLWRSVKYEEVYLNDYDSVTTAWRRLRDYFNFYNQQRFHQSLNYRTPHAVYFQ